MNATEHAVGSGTRHFWWQRVTALSNIPLTLFLIFSGIMLAGADYAETRSYVASPPVAVALFLLVLSWVTHMRIGLQTIIEDYVHDDSLKTTSLMLNWLVAISVAVVSGFALLTLVLGG